MWKRLEPELYFHAHLHGDLDPQLSGQVSEKALFLARVAFRKIYGTDVAFEVVIENGSIKVRVLATIGTVLLFLSHYGSIRSGSDYLYKDLRGAFTWVRDELEKTGLFAEKICVQRRVGVIGRIDQTLVEFEERLISRQHCVDKLVRLFEIVNESDQRQEIIHSLVEYIDVKHGDSFPWQPMEDSMRQIAALPSRRRKEDEEPEQRIELYQN